MKPCPQSAYRAFTTARALIPNADSTVNDVIFDITPGATFNAGQATIPISKAASGELFGRLYGTEN